jgi:hypothetical protein
MHFRCGHRGVKPAASDRQGWSRGGDAGRVIRKMEKCTICD